MRTITQQTIAAILALAMAFTFNACSGDDNGSDGGDPSISSSSGTETGNSSSSSSGGTDVSSSGGNVAQEECGTDKWYNIETHFCFESYNYENDSTSYVIYEKCGSEKYDPLYGRCQDNVVQYPCITDKWYNIATHFCSRSYNYENDSTSYAIYERCGGLEYDPQNGRCQNNVAQAQCGTDKWYNIATHFCDYYSNTLYEKCGGREYYPERQRCQNNVIQYKCGTDKWYNGATHFCSNDDIYEICSGKEYDTERQRCQNNVMQYKCGTDKWYSLETHFCSGNAIYEKCNSQWYNTTLQYCDNGTLKNNNNNNIGSITDSRDGKTYKTVVIGNQTWLAENLNYNATGSVCYDNAPANCEKYGRLYDWSTAMALPSSCNSSNCDSQVQAKHQGVCPSGWHLPSNAEFNTLKNYIANADSSYSMNKLLKATSGWNGSSNGIDSYGFSALPGGFKSNYDGNFYNVGLSGEWWIGESSLPTNNNAKYFGIEKNHVTAMNPNPIYKAEYISIRCVQD